MAVQCAPRGAVMDYITDHAARYPNIPVRGTEPSKPRPSSVTDSSTNPLSERR